LDNIAQLVPIRFAYLVQILSLWHKIHSLALMEHVEYPFVLSVKIQLHVKHVTVFIPSSWEFASALFRIANTVK